MGTSNPMWAQDTPNSEAGVRSIYVNANGPGFTTIAQALAWITASGTSTVAGAPRRIYLAPGTYTENFTLPTQTELYGIGVVTIVGTITCTAAVTTRTKLTNLNVTGSVVLGASAIGYVFENCTFTSTGIAIDADFAAGAFALTGSLVFRNCNITVTAGGTGILASACTIDIDQMIVSAAASTGISLLAGDSATEITTLNATRLTISGAAVTAGIITAAGAGGAASDQVIVNIVDLTLNVSGATDGVMLASPGTITATTTRNGAFIDALHCIGATTRTWFQSADAALVSVIGSIDGALTDGRLLDNVAGRLTVGRIDLPADGLTKVATFQVLQQTAGTVIIEGGVIAGSAAATARTMFDLATGATALTVSDMVLSNFRRVLVTAGLQGRVEFVRVRARGGLATGAGGALSLLEVDGDVGSPGALVLAQCVIEQANPTVLNADGPLFRFVDVLVDLIDTTLIQQAPGADCVQMVTGGPNIGLVWRGHCAIGQDTSGAGFGLVVPNSANNELLEEGVLAFFDPAAAVGVTPLVLQWFSVGAAVALFPRRGLLAVAQGSVSAMVAAGGYILGAAGFGVPAPAQGLHICTAIALNVTGSAGNDTLIITAENETTGQNSAAAVSTVDPAVGVQGFQTRNLTVPFLVAPGQAVSLLGGATGGGTGAMDCTLL